MNKYLSLFFVAPVFSFISFSNLFQPIEVSFSEILTAQISVISIQQLPPEARKTLDLIQKGGPFPYDRDGIVFRNREKILPLNPVGYYREYTVQTPGIRHRGARRIVTGQKRKTYYTQDHYQSFYRIKY